VSEHLHVKVGEGFKELLASRARGDRLAPSSWVREVLAAVVVAGVGLADLQALLQDRQGVDPARVVGRVRVNGQLGRAETLTGRCLHPMHLREHLPTYDRCACGRRMDRVSGHELGVVDPG
jgi:hypothetical protein